MMSDAVSWFPQEHAQTFYLVKGVLGMVGTLGLLFFMWKKWEDFKSRGQRLRFMCLLYFSVLVTAASAEQIQEGVEVSLRNIGGLGGAALLILTVVVSVQEDIMRRKPKNGSTHEGKVARATGRSIRH